MFRVRREFHASGTGIPPDRLNGFFPSVRKTLHQMSYHHAMIRYQK
jgi:hypothetical protein